MRIEDFPYYDDEIIDVDILKRYMQLYFKNLKVLYSSGITMRFVNCNDLHCVGRAELYNSKSEMVDKYLYKNDPKTFGNTIEKDGTYWVVSAKQNNNILENHEGSHRVEALKAIGSNKKLLCIVEEEEKFLNEPIEIYSLMLDKTAKLWLQGDLHLTKLEKIEPNIYIVGTNNLEYIYHIIYFFGAFLGRLIYRYRDQIKPSPIINSEEEFYKFVNS